MLREVFAEQRSTDSLSVHKDGTDGGCFSIVPLSICLNLLLKTISHLQPFAQTLTFFQMILFVFVFFSERILTTVTYAFNFNTLPSLPGGKPATE